MELAAPCVERALVVRQQTPEKLDDRRAGLQPHAEMAQGAQDFADLRCFLAILDFGNPRLCRADRLRKLGLGQLVMAARCGDDLADFSGGLCPHAPAPAPSSLSTIYSIGY